jgi:site-specific DNA recombinase
VDLVLRASGEANRLATDAARRLSRAKAYANNIADLGTIAGRYVWNRSQWAKDPDTGRRKYLLRPQSEWVVHTLPELRIV